MNRLFTGLIAGLAATAALEMTTYADMALRGRPASPLPRRSVQRAADAVDLRLDENRQEGLAPLLGYATGLATATGYALVVRGRLRGPASAAALTAVAMLAANVPLTLSGLTDPRRWTVTDWLADLVPHMAFGAVGAAVIDALDRR